MKVHEYVRKLKQKDFFNEIEYDKLYPSGSAPAGIYGHIKCTNSERCCNFYSNSFRFCAVKKNCKYVQQYCT